MKREVGMERTAGFQFLADSGLQRWRFRTCSGWPSPDGGERLGWWPRLWEELWFYRRFGPHCGGGPLVRRPNDGAMRRGGAPRNLQLGHSAHAACPVRAAGRCQGLEEEGWSGEGRMGRWRFWAKWLILSGPQLLHVQNGKDDLNDLLPWRAIRMSGLHKMSTILIEG